MSVGVADAARFCRTPVVSGRAGQVASRCEIGDGATIPTAVANSDIALGPDRELAGVGCAKKSDAKAWNSEFGKMTKTKRARARKRRSPLST